MEIIAALAALAGFPLKVLEYIDHIRRLRTPGTVEIGNLNGLVLVTVVYHGILAKAQIDRAIIECVRPKHRTLVPNDVVSHPKSLHEPFDSGTRKFIYLDPSAPYGDSLKRKFRIRIELVTGKVLVSKFQVPQPT